MGALVTYNPNWGHGSNWADDGRDGAEFTSLWVKKNNNNALGYEMIIKYIVMVAMEIC